MSFRGINVVRLGRFLVFFFFFFLFCMKKARIQLWRPDLLHGGNIKAGAETIMTLEAARRLIMWRRPLRSASYLTSSALVFGHQLLLTGPCPCAVSPCISHTGALPLFVVATPRKKREWKPSSFQACHSTRHTHRKKNGSRRVRPFFFFLEIWVREKRGRRSCFLPIPRARLLFLNGDESFHSSPAQCWLDGWKVRFNIVRDESQFVSDYYKLH